MTTLTTHKPDFLEFFAGSGLVAYGLRDYFTPVWANDICEKKAVVYAANHDSQHFQLGSISDVRGSDLPKAELSWASFPCQDLSLAGMTAGIHARRSGLVWQWLRIMDEMRECPKVLVAENVTGLMSADGGSHYRILHRALRDRGYSVGAVLLDAVHWVPQSRQRIFVIAVKDSISIPSALTDRQPNWLHNAAVVKAADGLDGFVFWKMPKPDTRATTLADMIQWDAECASPEVTARTFSLVPQHQRVRLISDASIEVAPGYRRTRDIGQSLELRFDGVAGCLRTAVGGSSRQVVVLKREKHYDTRLLTVREAARLMGAPETYCIPGSYNEGYTAMGDAVAVPVASFLARTLLAPLAESVNL